jgi:hypothetical protein
MKKKRGLFVDSTPAMYNCPRIRIKAEIVATATTGLIMLSINNPPFQMAK